MRFRINSDPPGKDAALNSIKIKRIKKKLTEKIARNIIAIHTKMCALRMINKWQMLLTRISIYKYNGGIQWQSFITIR